MCHGALKQETGLRLDTGDLILRGTDDGPIIVPGKSGESPLIAAVTRTENRMPAEGRAALRGTKSPCCGAGSTMGCRAAWRADSARPTTLGLSTSATSDSADRCRGGRDGSNPSTRFLPRWRRKRTHGQRPAADRGVLLRVPGFDSACRLRVPSCTRFWRTTRPTLMNASWTPCLRGRTWRALGPALDGLTALTPIGPATAKKCATASNMSVRWRDWIVESLNADRGYDRMIVYMLAGDEVRPDDPCDAVRRPDTWPATGFASIATCCSTIPSSIWARRSWA